MTQADGDRQRLDKWLWFARFLKSRSLATVLAASGKLRQVVCLCPARG